MLKIDQSGVLFFAGWGSLCVKLGASIVFCPMQPPGKPMKRGLGCIIMVREERSELRGDVSSTEAQRRESGLMLCNKLNALTQRVCEYFS